MNKLIFLIYFYLSLCITSCSAEIPIVEEFLKMLAVYCKADDKCEWTIIPWLLTKAKRLDWALTKSWNSLKNYTINKEMENKRLSIRT